MPVWYDPTADVGRDHHDDRRQHQSHDVPNAVVGFQVSIGRDGGKAPDDQRQARGQRNRYRERSPRGDDSRAQLALVSGDAEKQDQAQDHHQQSHDALP
jgi:hypothetical protein